MFSCIKQNKKIIQFAGISFIIYFIIRIVMPFIFKYTYSVPVKNFIDGLFLTLVSDLSPFIYKISTINKSFHKIMKDYSHALFYKNTDDKFNHSFVSLCFLTFINTSFACFYPFVFFS